MPSPLPLEAHIRHLLQRSYPTGDFRLRPLGGGGTLVYHVQRRDGPDWVLRTYPTGAGPDSAAAAARLAHLLAFLEAHRFPAERVVANRDGAPVAQHDAGHALVTTYLGASVAPWQPASGRPAGRTSTPAAVPTVEMPRVFHALGSLLGALHALVPDPMPGASLPPAGMAPASELAWAAATFDRVAHPVPEALRELQSTLARRLQDLSRFEACPRRVIHSDPHLGNAIVTAGGDVRLTDWECAGLGAAVTDLGTLLRLCVLRDRDEPDAGCIRAAVRGYCQHRTLEAGERAVLVDAIQLRTLILLAASFGRRSGADYDEATPLYGQSYGRWLRHYHLAPQIAEQAAVAFEAAR